MLAYIVKRLLLMIPTLLGVLLLTFVVIQFVPGGPVEQMVSQLQGRDSGGESAAVSSSGYRGRQGVDAARIEEIKQLYGFDKPASERFIQMLGQFARFDLGKSFFYPKDVWTLVKEKLPVSISLGLWTFFISYLISVPLGIAKAVRAGSRFDSLTSLVVLTGYAIPGFVLGVALLVVFGGQLQWFPLRGLTSANWEQLGFWARITDYLWHIALPVASSVLGAFAVTTVLTKNAVLEEIRKQYVLTARAKGLSDAVVTYKHALRNAMMPIVTIAGLQFGNLISGAVLVETVFSWPGLGTLALDAILGRDYPTLLGVLTFSALLVILANLMTDFSYRWIDPRLRGK